MKKDTKNQIFTMIVLLLFVGSGLAYSISSVFPVQEKPKLENVFYKSLSDSEEAAYIQQNRVVMKYFYSPTCSACQQQEPILEEVMEEFKNNIITEKINIFEYRDAISAFDIRSTPTFILKGNSIEKIEEIMDKDALTKKICGLYLNPIEICTSS